MINLELLDACQNCSNLEPIKTNAHTLMYAGEIVDQSCTITCSNIDKCRALLQYLRTEELKNG